MRRRLKNGIIRRDVPMPEVERLAGVVYFKIKRRKHRGRRIHYDVILAPSRGGLVPACYLSQVLQHHNLLPIPVRRYKRGRQYSNDPPKILYFPRPEYLRGKKVLIIDDVWDKGHSIVAVWRRALLCGARLVHVAVLHYKPRNSAYPELTPTYFGEITEDWLDYFWETFPKRLRTMRLRKHARCVRKERPNRRIKRGA